MTNRARGEVPVTVGDTTLTLCLTMEAMANLEDALDLPISRIGEKLGDETRVSDLIRIVRALSFEPVPPDFFRKAGPKDIQTIAEAVGECFNAAGFEEAESGNA